MSNDDSRAQQLLARIRQQRAEVESLREFYLCLFAEQDVPADRQFHIWLQRYGFDGVTEALEATSEWFNKVLQMAEERAEEGKSPIADLCKGKLDIIKYASGCMKRSKQRAEGTFVEPTDAD